MITGLDLLFLEVNNLEDSLAFYNQVGFEIDSHEPNAEPPIASVKSKSLRITLVQQIEKESRFRRHVMTVGAADSSTCKIQTGIVCSL